MPILALPRIRPMVRVSTPPMSLICVPNTCATRARTAGLIKVFLRRTGIHPFKAGGGQFGPVCRRSDVDPVIDHLRQVGPPFRCIAASVTLPEGGKGHGPSLVPQSEPS